MDPRHHINPGQVQPLFKVCLGLGLDRALVFLPSLLRVPAKLGFF
jgi:hypothetical protein